MQLFCSLSFRQARRVAGFVLGLALLSACAAPTLPAPLPAATAQPAASTLVKEAPTIVPSLTAAASTQETATPQPNATSPASPTPAGQGAVCASPAALTPAMTEGPYFKAGSPERASLLQGQVKGKKLVLSGQVLDADCKPVAHALLDFWQADADGQYDNAGYTFRGHQYTDANGRYQLETVVPGLYPGRTEHIHVKVKAPNGPVLTSQLFFPGVVQNDSDGIFDQRLLIQVQEQGDGLLGVYNFVVNAS